MCARKSNTVRAVHAQRRTLRANVHDDSPLSDTRRNPELRPRRVFVITICTVLLKQRNYCLLLRALTLGKFASVRKIRHLKSGVEYAAKFIRKRRRAADATREIQHEVAVLALCAQCDRVVKLHEVYETSSEVAIVLELAAGGELQRVLDEEERLPERCARKALRHALEGLQHMHARRIAHLDLKPQNLLLAAGKEDLLICDFGISRAILPGARVREILGTRDYVAPEILSYEPLSLAADIWSVGVLAYVLLSGYSPFAGDTKQETYLNIAQCQLSFPRDCFRGVSPLAKKFIRETLVVDPKGRLTVEECLAHPWLKDDVDLPCAIVGLGFDSAAEPADDSDPEEATELRNGHATHNGRATRNGRSAAAARDHKDASEGRPSSPVNGTTDSRGPTSASAPAHEENGCGEEREKPLKHPHGRETSPPFPDAPSTPKVSRKSHPHPPSVLALCKKFQPDYEKPAKLAHAHHTSHSAHAPAADACGCGYECGGHTCLRPRAPLPPDRAVIC